MSAVPAKLPRPDAQRPTRSARSPSGARSAERAGGDGPVPVPRGDAVRHAHRHLLLPRLRRAASGRRRGIAPPERGRAARSPPRSWSLTTVPMWLAARALGRAGATARCVWMIALALVVQGGYLGGPGRSCSVDDLRPVHPQGDRLRLDLLHAAGRPPRPRAARARCSTSGCSGRWSRTWPDQLLADRRAGAGAVLVRRQRHGRVRGVHSAELRRCEDRRTSNALRVVRRARAAPAPGRSSSWPTSVFSVRSSATSRRSRWALPSRPGRSCCSVARAGRRPRSGCA